MDYNSLERFIDAQKASNRCENHAKNRYRFVWDHDVAGSNPVIPTKISDLTAKSGQIGAN